MERVCGNGATTKMPPRMQEEVENMNCDRESVAEGRGKNLREKKSVDRIAERKESVT